MSFLPSPCKCCLWELFLFSSNKKICFCKSPWEPIIRKEPPGQEIEIVIFPLARWFGNKVRKCKVYSVLHTPFSQFWTTEQRYLKSQRHFTISQASIGIAIVLLFSFFKSPMFFKVISGTSVSELISNDKNGLSWTHHFWSISGSFLLSNQAILPADKKLSIVKRYCSIFSRRKKYLERK